MALPIGCADVPGHADLASLVAKHAEARGGAAAIEAIRSYEADVRIVEPTFEVDGSYIATRDGRMRIERCSGAGTGSSSPAVNRSKASTITS